MYINIFIISLFKSPTLLSKTRNGTDKITHTDGNFITNISLPYKNENMVYNNSIHFDNIGHRMPKFAFKQQGTLVIM